MQLPKQSKLLIGLSISYIYTLLALRLHYYIARLLCQDYLKLINNIVSLSNEHNFN